MKVVLFCGGLGMRMRDGVTSGPKPMAMVGERPLLWHVMRYYAHFGHTDFVLCLGYGASAVKDFFLNYDETTVQRFRPRERRPRGQAVQDRHLRLADHLRRHRPALPDRRAAAPGPPLRRRRADVPGQLRGRPHERAAAGHDRAVRGQRRRSEPARGAPAVVAPRGGHRRGRAHHAGDSRARPAASGRTAATSCSGRRSSITSTKARISSRTRSSGWSRSSGSWPTRTRDTGRRPTR